MNILENAKEIAYKAHHGQVRKWSNPVQPYIIHPQRVADKVKSLSGTNDVDVAVAYDHDVLEDCGKQWAEVIREKCGDDVLDGVNWLTFETDLPEWSGRSRAEKNVVRYAHMRKMPQRWQKIKMVDRWDNILDMENAPHKLVHKVIDESWVLLEICKDADTEMAKELESVIKAIEKKRA